MKNTKQVTVTLSRRMADHIEWVAAENGDSVSGTIRVALARSMNERDTRYWIPDTYSKTPSSTN